jgi:PAS domain-containing protein
MLWVSLIIGAALAATIALTVLDRQRRGFFADHRSAHAPRRLRYALSRVRDRLGSSTAARRASGGDGAAAPAPGTLMRSPGTVPRRGRNSPARRRPRKEHAARIVLRAMREAGPSPMPLYKLRSKPAPTAAPSTDSVAAPQPGIGAGVSAASSAAAGILRVERSGQVKFADSIARDLLHWSAGELTLGDILIGGTPEAVTLMEAVARQEVVEQTVAVRSGTASEQLHATAFASRGSDGSLWGALLILRRL